MRYIDISILYSFCNCIINYIKHIIYKYCYKNGNILRFFFFIIVRQKRCWLLLLSLKRIRAVDRLNLTSWPCHCIRTMTWSHIRDDDYYMFAKCVYVQMLEERAMQVKFNEAKKARTLEEKRLLKLEQNADAERYARDQCEQKMKRAREKEALIAIFLKEWVEIRSEVVWIQ